jgi:hypothetical protein
MALVGMIGEKIVNEDVMKRAMAVAEVRMAGLMVPPYSGPVTDYESESEAEQH